MITPPCYQTGIGLSHRQKTNPFFGSDSDSDSCYQEKVTHGGENVKRIRISDLDSDSDFGFLFLCQEKSGMDSDLDSNLDSDSDLDSDSNLDSDSHEKILTSTQIFEVMDQYSI